MPAVMPRAGGVVLASLGTLLIRLALSDRLLAYVRSGARPEVLACGIAIGVLGSVVVLGERRPVPTGKTSAKPWLMLIPAAALVLVPTPGQGVQLAAAAPARHAKPGSLAPVLRGPEPISLRLAEFVTRAQWARPSLVGHELRVIGFGERSHGHDLLARLSITCCAADAEEDDILLTGRPTGSVGLHQWVVVIGRFAGMSSWDPVIPVLAIESLRPLVAPSDPYD